jgi:peptide/nickel transport system substrate-binding protein
MHLDKKGDEMKTLRITLYALILVSLLASGCAQPVATPVATEPPAAVSEPEPVAMVPEPAEGHNPDSIVRWTEDWPTYIDPAVGNDFSDSMALVNLYDSLVFPELDGSIVPHVATEWTVSPDNLIYTFKLRQDVKFHNGVLLTAGDVVFSAERFLTIGEGYSYLLQTKDRDGNIIAGIESVSVIDDHTVEFRLVKPFGPFVSALVRLYLVNKDQVMANIDKSDTMYGDLGDYGKKWLLTNDAGSGPYMVKEMKMEEHLLAEKFDDYWGGWEEGSPDFLKEFAYPGEVAIRTLMNNREMEISSETLPPEGYRALDAIHGIDTVVWLAPHNLQIMLNTQKPPTDDIHFRKAISYIMDYSVVVNDIWPEYLQSVGPVPQTLPGQNPNVFQYSYNIEKAREEMAKSKYAGQDNIHFTLSWCAEVPAEERVALLFQSNAAEIGVDVEIFKKPFGSMIDDAQTVDTTPNGSIVYVAAHYNEAGSILETRYHSKSQGTWEQCEWLGSPAIDAAIEEALATVDQTERFAKYAEIQEMLVDLAPTIWLADQAMEFAYQDYVYWPVVERVKAGLAVSPVMGYSHYARDMKIDLARKAELSR